MKNSYLITATVIVLIGALFFFKENKSQIKIDEVKIDKTELINDNPISLKNNIELQANIPLNKVVIYKTKDNYNNLVPISLAEDKQTITSYPDMKDLTSSSEPTPLKDNYLMDNRGINKNSVFLNMTYSEYRVLTELPSLDTLKSKIKNNNPFLEMYNCSKTKNNTEQVEYINSLIESQNLKKECDVLI